MYGQLKSKPKMENCSHLTSKSGKKKLTSTAINSAIEQFLLTTKSDSNRFQTVRRINDDFRSRPDKMADRNDVQRTSTKSAIAQHYQRLSTTKQDGRRLSTITSQLL